MRCEQARAHLFEHADEALPEHLRSAVSAHLEGCPVCREDYESIVELTLRASVWHDVPAPRWQPPVVGARLGLESFRQWFPSVASALALLLVVGLYLRPPAPEGAAAPRAPVAGTLPVQAGSALPVSASVESLLTSNRLERQQELQALVQLLRAEMDRRSEETEESLRYVIAHQLQGQREIDDLYQYVRKVSAATGAQLAPGAGIGPGSGTGPGTGPGEQM